MAGDGTPRLDGIDYLGLDRVLKRGTGQIIEADESAVLVWDGVSGAHFLACGDAGSGLALLEVCEARGCNLLMVSDVALGRIAFERLGFSEKFDCYQVAYYGDIPARDPRVRVREAEEGDLPLLIQSYDLISPEEMRRVVERRTLLLGYGQDKLIGFIGEHLEGSMGLLYIFPEFRRRGFAAALENHFIAWTMERGFVPFGQVKKDSLPSLMLQQKLGMTQSDRLISWMWK